MNGLISFIALYLPKGIEGCDEEAGRLTRSLEEPTERVGQNIDSESKGFLASADAIVRGPVRSNLVVGDFCVRQ
jgi:hypothetical protein